MLDHPAADKAAYGQAVRQRSEMGGGWLCWVLSVDDIGPYEERLDRKAIEGRRNFPDGRSLEWSQIGIRGVISDPQLPYFITWTSPEDVRPAALGGDIKLSALEISGSRKRVEDWIGLEVPEVFDGVEFSFHSPSGYPGLDAVTFETSNGTVRI